MLTLTQPMMGEQCESAPSWQLYWKLITLFKYMVNNINKTNTHTPTDTHTQTNTHTHTQAN